jgi:hypothetical protein
MNKEKKRSIQQNRALHKLFTDLAKECQKKGITVRQLYEKGFDVMVTKEIFKNDVWRKIQIAMFDKESTKDLTTQEINQIFDVINKEFADWEIHIPFPSTESMMEYYEEIERKEKLTRKSN